MRNDPEVLRARDRTERKRFFGRLLSFILVFGVALSSMITYYNHKMDNMLEFKFDSTISRAVMFSNGPIFVTEIPRIERNIDSVIKNMGDKFSVHRIWANGYTGNKVRILFKEKESPDSYYMGFIKYNGFHKIPVELKSDRLSEIIVPKKKSRTSNSWRINYNDDLLEFDENSRITQKLWKRTQE